MPLSLGHLLRVISRSLLSLLSLAMGCGGSIASEPASDLRTGASDAAVSVASHSTPARSDAGAPTPDATAAPPTPDASTRPTLSSDTSTGADAGVASCTVTVTGAISVSLPASAQGYAATSGGPYISLECDAATDGGSLAMTVAITLPDAGSGATGEAQSGIFIGDGAYFENGTGCTVKVLQNGGIGGFFVASFECEALVPGYVDAGYTQSVHVVGAIQTILEPVVKG